MTTFGISIGATTGATVDETGEIHRNELGGHTTASLVAFTGEGRQLGEAAVSGLSANAKSTAMQVGRLALLPYDAHTTGDGERTSRHWQFGHAAGDDGKMAMVDVAVAGKSEPQTIGGVALLGALLGKMRQTSNAPEGAPVSIALPPAVDESARACLADAATIGGWSLVAAPTAADALGTALARKWPFPKDAAPTPIHVLVLDMGAQSTIAAVIELTPPVTGEVATEAAHKVLCETSDAFLGTGLFDEALFDHFAAKISEKYGEGVSPASRRGLRLSTAIERLRKLLSTLPEAGATAENLIDGIDVPLSATREELSTLCEGPLQRLRALLDNLLTSYDALPYDGDTSTLTAVETLGGGCRTPAVQQILSEALTASTCGAAIATEKPGAKLDDASMATGAAILGKAVAATAAAPPPLEGAPAADTPASAATAATVAGALAADALAALVATEKELAAADAAAAARGAVFNELEGYILESRGLSSRKHGSKVDTATLNPLLDASEDWMYSEECEGAGVEVLRAKLTSLKGEVEAATAAYMAAVAADKAAEESALEAASAAAAAEKAANGEDEDHDQRRLKYPDRLRLVTKNKEEGTELFKGAVDITQFRGACARYNKALTHAAKFVDLSPDQKEEVTSIKLSLHLNIAMCWLKITDAENHLDQAIRSCDEALALDEKCVKALFRRATAREQKGLYDEAKNDLTKAKELDPDDKAVPKLMTRVEAQIARQKAKEKKMYGVCLFTLRTALQCALPLSLTDILTLAAVSVHR